MSIALAMMKLVLIILVFMVNESYAAHAYKELKSHSEPLTMSKKILPMGPPLMKQFYQKFAEKPPKQETHKYKQKIFRSLVQIDFSKTKDPKTGKTDLSKTEFTKHSFSVPTKEAETMITMFAKLYHDGSLKENDLFRSSTKSTKPTKRRRLPQTAVHSANIPQEMEGIGALWYYGETGPWVDPLVASIIFDEYVAGDFWSPWCSASVINEYYILLAGHCIMMSKVSMHTGGYYLTDPETLFFFPSISSRSAPPGAPRTIALAGIDYFEMIQAWVPTEWYNKWHNGQLEDEIGSYSLAPIDIAVIRVRHVRGGNLQHPMRIHAYVDGQWPNGDGNYWWYSGYPSRFNDAVNWAMITTYDHGQGTIEKRNYLSGDNGDYLEFTEPAAEGFSGSAMIANDGQVYGVVAGGGEANSAHPYTAVCPITRDLYVAYCMLPDLIDCRRIDEYLGMVRQMLEIQQQQHAKLGRYNYMYHDEKRVGQEIIGSYQNEYDQGYFNNYGENDALILLEYISIEVIAIFVICICCIGGAFIIAIVAYFKKKVFNVI